jgi:hypothetical protein
VLSQAGNILLQKRGAQALHPFELDISASGAVDEGETRLEAAKRELLEETSIAGVELQPVAEPFRSPGTINAVYSVIVPDKTSFIFDRSEVDDLLWVSLSELNELIALIPSVVPAGVSQGDTGVAVSLLQTYLIFNSQGPAQAALASASATGYFGPITTAALVEYQAENKLDETGLFDTDTKEEMS